MYKWKISSFGNIKKSEQEILSIKVFDNFHIWVILESLLEKLKLKILKFWIFKKLKFFIGSKQIKKECEFFSV